LKAGHEVLEDIQANKRHQGRDKELGTKVPGNDASFLDSNVTFAPPN